MLEPNVDVVRVGQGEAPEAPPSLAPGTASAGYVAWDQGVSRQVDGCVIDEGQACIYVNGVELATLMCSPVHVEDLAIGFLRLEGFIREIADIRHMTMSEGGRCADIWLRHEITPPARRIITAGCGGGLTFDDLAASREPLASARTVTHEQVTHGMRQLQHSGELYRLARGVHTASLSDGDRPVFVAQDIGRHNTLDRLCGRALAAGYDTRDHILFASGRISSEMLGKAWRMGVPIVVSRTSPTSLSVKLARAWNITVVGYCRGRQFRVYSAPERIVAVA